ncbi:protein RETARDED ROOT GROWTH-LIKE isoform X2 [Populus trichocarpa]|uniref:protein RETARDED ROOT GROWTH-LIKE isoform X2 n=1 Tax=Populus trichocarpa TaxID=3694 RepID=UPI002277E46B|nr:protein RETARDED ROOT GROWTH-LIKE isoform X2 [Populus trichocarpa]XP_024461917.2 protein RETARDED ROOT GROWTH-LIKE isoform X2 [Populus trichocarpa]
MWRTIDAHLRTVRLPVRTVLLSHHQYPPSLPPLKPPKSLHFFSLSETLTISSSTPYPPSPILAFTTRCINSVAFGRGRNLVPVRCISSISSSAAPNQQHTAVGWNEPVTCSELGDGGKGTNIEEDARQSIPVRAFLFSTSVDLKSLVEQNKKNFIPPTSRMTNYVVLKFGNLSQAPGLGSCISGSNCCYMVVFQYGSIVLFNVREHEVDEYLNLVRKHASGLLPETRKDEYEVREKPTLNTWMQGGLDYIMLQFLNTDGIRMIGSVLGQSIALDYYGRQVDGMVAEFTDINRGMEKTGTFSMDSKKLFQIVGKANSNLADVILKLGLFESSQNVDV